MKKYKDLIITTIVCLLPMLIGAYFYNRLPDQMVTHWGVDGPNGWSSKATACFGMPGMMAGLNVLVHFFMNNDPKKRNYSIALRNISKWLMPAGSLIFTGITIADGLGYSMNVNSIVPVLIGFLFVVLGNYLPKCKQNFTMGIRCPWTLSSEENWNKTHRVGGYIMILAGILIIFTAFVNMPAEVMVGGILLVAVIPVLYSFYLYKKGI